MCICTHTYNVHANEEEGQLNCAKQTQGVVRGNEKIYGNESVQLLATTTILYQTPEDFDTIYSTEIIYQMFLVFYIRLYVQ